ncbi:MAG: LacI family DNA-binding transcriptional regulator [Gemmatimonadaceae bacterium]|nr:LacI family DNA-binding transcriptional regulator [Gemmatimonadaceae bacterium]
MVKVTIREVARAAGVSVATVSRVLNDSGPVNGNTKQRVRDAAGSLRYVPHGGAQSLIKRRTSTLGVLLPDLYGEFFSEVLRGIDFAAKRSGYHMLVSGSHDDRDEIVAAMRAMRGRVDGLVIMSPDIDAAALIANIPDSLPVVLLNCAVSDGGYDSINIDNVGGAQNMVRHLVSHGHTRIAIITGAERNLDARERLRGYRAALRAEGLTHTARWELTGDFTEDSGHAAARRLLKLRPRPTAIFAANDAMAVGAISALRDAFVNVPDEIAVAGFDDIPIARHVSPALSSVHVPIAELGEKAIGKLLRAVVEKEKYVRRQDVLRTTLVIRNSCGAPGHV